MINLILYKIGIRQLPGNSCLYFRKRWIMTDTYSDALVFFGVTGDLAYKQIFPALQAMVRRGHLNMPVIGVAGRPWTIEQLQAHVHDSLAEHSGVDKDAFAKLCSLLQYVSGDYHDQATYTKLRQ